MKNIEDMKTPVEVKKIPEAQIAPKRMKGIPEKEAQTGEEIKKAQIAPKRMKGIPEKEAQTGEEIKKGKKIPVEVKKIPEAQIAPRRMKGIPEKEAQTGEEIKKEKKIPVKDTAESHIYSFLFCILVILYLKIPKSTNKKVGQKNTAGKNKNTNPQISRREAINDTSKEDDIEKKNENIEDHEGSKQKVKENHVKTNPQISQREANNDKKVGQKNTAGKSKNTIKEKTKKDPAIDNFPIQNEKVKTIKDPEAIIYDCHEYGKFSSKHKPKPPDELSNSGIDKKVELKKDSEEMEFDSIVMEVYNTNIENKNETNLKQNITSEHGHEPPDDLSNSRIDKKVELIKDSEEIDFDPTFMEMYNVDIKNKNETNSKQNVTSEPPDDLSKSEYDKKAELIKNYIKTEHKLEKKKSEEDFAIPLIATEMVTQNNSVNNAKEIFEEFKIEVNNSEENLTIPSDAPQIEQEEIINDYKEEANGKKDEDFTVQNDRDKINNDHNNYKDKEEFSKKMCSMYETNLKQHITSKHKPPDELSNSRIDKKVELKKDSEEVDFDSIVMEMYDIDIENKNETNLKQHITSEQEHEPPDDISNSGYDKKVELIKDLKMTYNCHKCEMCELCNNKFKNRTNLKKHINDEHRLNLTDKISDPDYEENNETVKDPEAIVYDCHECGRFSSKHRHKPPDELSNSRIDKEGVVGQNPMCAHFTRDGTEAKKVNSI